MKTLHLSLIVMISFTGLSMCGQTTMTVPDARTHNLVTGFVLVWPNGVNR